MKHLSTLFSTGLILLPWSLMAQSSCIIAEYPLNGDALDIGPAGNNGQITGTIIPVQDRNGDPSGAIQFNGSSYIVLPANYDLPERTWSMWIYAESITAQNQQIMDHDHAGIQNGQTEISLQEVGGVKTLFLLLGTAVHAEPVNEEEWYHIALTRSTDSIALYLNGCLATSSTNLFNDHSIDNDLPEPALGVDRFRTDLFFTGRLDDLRVYDCALSPADIEVLAENTCITLGMASVNGTADLLAHPNPTEGLLHITGLGNATQGAQADLIDGSGRLVLRSLITGPTLSLDLSPYEVGFYFLRIQGKTGTRSLRVVKN
jgi:hypothetical protein